MSSSSNSNSNNIDQFNGFLNKKSKYRKQFKKRFFEIKGNTSFSLSLLTLLTLLCLDGLIKYYTTCNNSNNKIGNGLRGIYDLAGVKILPLNNEFPLRLCLITPQDRKNEIVLEAESEIDVKIYRFFFILHLILLHLILLFIFLLHYFTFY